MRTRSVLAAAAVLPLALSVMAHASSPDCRVFEDPDPQTSGDEVMICQLQTWFTNTDSPVANATYTGETSPPTWTTEEPHAAMAEGAGGGGFGSSIVGIAEPGDLSGVRFVGTFEGLLDTIDITLHGYHNGYGRTATPTWRDSHTADVVINLNGLPVFQNEVDFHTTPAGPVNTAGKFRLTVAGLATYLPSVGLSPDGSHELEIVVTPKYINTNPVAGYAWGSTDFPGGVTFNPVEVDPHATALFDLAG